MADDLISRKALIAEYDRVHIGPPGGARKLMEDAPAVDAVEVVHADWKDCENADFVYCTNCKKEWNVFDNCAELFYYCPNCGAKMDGGNEDG